MFYLAEYENFVNQLKFCTFLRSVMNTVGVKHNYPEIFLFLLVLN